MYVVYLLKCENKTYIGMTNDFFRRWRQHIGDLKGGARYTSCQGKDWYPILIIDGFETIIEAMQCEWKLKRKRGLVNRVCWIHKLLTQYERWTTKSPKIADQNLIVYIDPLFAKHFKEYPTRELYWR